ncbi:MAG: FapA family protein [Fibrobacterales bacterium]
MGTPIYEALDELISVSIEDNGYKAFVSVKKNREDFECSNTQVIEFLKDKKVTYGYSLDAIKKIILRIKGREPGEAILIASGKVKEEGKDGSEKYKFRTKMMIGAEVDDKVDYKERKLVNNMRPGQILAVIKKHIYGKPGLKVTGEKEEAVPVRKVGIPNAGLHVQVFEKEGVLTYVAMSAGHARLIFNEIQVTSNFAIVGDLDLTKGNIDFVGDVEITGDVASGFKINAGGNIIIGGNVEPNAVIIAKKDIIVKKTIRCGKSLGGFVAGGDITAGTILNSRIENKGDVYVKDMIADSEIFSMGHFSCSWGTILGSTIEAVSGISVNSIGKESGVGQNIIIAGNTDINEEALEKADQGLLNLNNELNLIIKNIPTKTEESTDENKESNAERLKNLNKARAVHVEELNEKIKALQEEKEYLESHLHTNPDAVIEIRGKVYPTATIINGLNRMLVFDDVESACSLEYQAPEMPEMREDT